MNKLLSVILPVYNGEKFVAEAVQSVLNQTFKDFNLIIINDGSRDSSLEILKELEREDERIALINQTNQGLVKSLNLGIERSKSKYVARMDADDICFPDRFEKQINYLECNHDIAVIGSAISIIDTNGNLIRDSYYPETPEEIKHFAQSGSPLAHPTVIFRTEIVRNLGGYRSQFNHCEDYDLWLRVLDKYKIANLNVPLLKYRQHSSNVSFNHYEKQCLGTAIAKLSAISRNVHGIDPIEFVENLNVDSFGLFNNIDSKKVDGIKFEFLNSSINYCIAKNEIEKAVDQISAINSSKLVPNPTKATYSIKISFYMLRNKHFIQALKYLMMAFMKSPKTVFIYSKTKLLPIVLNKLSRRLSIY